MTNDLIYTSYDEFDADYLEALIQEVDALAQEHRWWRQPIAVAAHPRNPSLLHGYTKLMHRYIDGDGAAPRKLDYREDTLMGMVDYLTIVEMLTLLSKEHEFTWELFQPAEPRPKLIGRIEDGELDAKIIDFLLPEINALEITDRELEDQALHERIRAKYFGSK
ncbi:hypothetical protein [Pelagicoccus sp. SDUM812003]|uniref:hypothetical protein n=1 Tax=Pelagicoccus sp. SDUM812003 TaxID=3041267 RepID=UPI00280E7914|nr:hypothetical protein [Pelagicoccus sp. SDUM812003]MDQ8201900.1 hypothetical protein [Pelagicoccus sp. SDUM812003]